MIAKAFQSLWKVVNTFLLELAETGGVHGLRQICNNELNPFERITWFLIIMAASTGAFYITSNQFERYRVNPTVISLDRNYRAWNGTLPAATICYHDHMDGYKADQFLQDNWNISITDEEYFYFLEFLYAVINATATNYAGLANFAEDERFQDIDLFDIAKSVDRPFDQVLESFDETLVVHIQSVMTERGMCYAFNSPMAEMLKERKVKIESVKKPISCQYGKEQCFIKLDIFESTGTIEVHSPFEISGSGKEIIELQKSDEILATYKVTETVASDTLRDLNPTQRKCVFSDEYTADLQIYSKSLCLSKCRAAMALEMCNCVPFFYPFVDGPSCNPAGFECLNDFKWPVWALHVCKCPPTCTEQKFSLHSLKRSSWGGHSNIPFQATSSFRWDIIPPKVRVRRDVLFSFEDLLVSFGGAASLFLGLSFLSFSAMSLVIAKNLIQLILWTYRSIRDMKCKWPGSRKNSNGSKSKGSGYKKLCIKRVK